MSELIMIGVFALVIGFFAYRSSDNEELEAKRRIKKLEKAKNKANANSGDEEYKDRPFYRHDKNFTLKNKYASVTIAHEIDACDAVQQLDDQRFLVRDAPLLPVRGCTKSKSCDCHYLHHADRRSIDRRTGLQTAEVELPQDTTDEDHRHKVRRGEDRYKRA